MRDDFLSPSELSFYLVLSQVLAGRAVICPKVRLADLLFVVDRNQNQSYANKIAQKHVDFVLCTPGTMKPIAAIELDDSSHSRRDRQERDDLVDQIFAAAELPLRHVPAQRQYNVVELSELLTPLLGEASERPRSTLPTATGPVSSTPSCPKCSVAMVDQDCDQRAKPGKAVLRLPEFSEVSRDAAGGCGLTIQCAQLERIGTS